MTHVIILCGGAGLRLRAITGDGPKSLARVGGRPFLEMLLRQLHRAGFDRAILAVGYGADAVRSHFGCSFDGMTIQYSQEASPLGTGGALSNALCHAKTGPCLVLNGDSYTDVDLRMFVTSYLQSDADVSVLVVPADERSDVGSVLLDDANNIVHFAEKAGPATGGHVNAGIYMLSADILQGIPRGIPISLEQELFPFWIREGRRIRSFIHRGNCIDIGTPDRYRTAQESLGPDIASSMCDERRDRA